MSSWPNTWLPAGAPGPTLLLLSVSAFAAAGGAVAAPDSSQGSADIEELVAVARQSLLTDLRQAYPGVTRIEAALTGRPAARVPAGAELSILPERHTLTAHQRVWVNVRRNGELLRSVPVWFALRAMAPVLVTEQFHRAHESLDRSTVRVEERDIALMSDLPLEREADLELLRTRHAMSAGHALLRRDFEERPPILAGEDVTVRVTYRSIAIETRAVALREGRIGEPIALKNPDSARTYNARVTGPHRAEVIDQ